MKSQSETSLGAQPASTAVISELKEETTPVAYEESRVSLTQGHPTELPEPAIAAAATPKEMKESKSSKAPAVRVPQDKRAVKVASSKHKTVTSTPLKNSLPPLTAQLSAIDGEPISSGSDREEKVGGRSLVTEGGASQLLDSSSDLVEVTDSEMSIMSGLNQNTTEDVHVPVSTKAHSEMVSNEKSNGAARHMMTEIKSGWSGDDCVKDEVSEDGDAGDSDESVSVTVTELSGDDEEGEEIEEDIGESEEDTMFEETLQESGTCIHVCYTYLGHPRASVHVHVHTMCTKLSLVMFLLY